VGTSIASLQHLLEGRWAVLFSHPDDFACYGFECDRWLEEVRQAFTAAGVRPLALQAAILGGCSWVSDVGGALLGRPAGWLLGGLSRLLYNGPERGRFVLMLDDLLWPRRTFRYEPGGALPSPIEFAAAAGALRRISPSLREYSPACRAS
jgi:hypothetical protein